MNSHHNHSKIAVAASLAVSITYTICTLLVAIFPSKALQIYYSIMHLAAHEQMKIQITIANFLTGLITLTIFSFVLAYLIDYFHCMISARTRK